MRIVLDKLWVGCKNYTDLVGFGEGGWGRVLIAGAGVTSAIAVLGFLIGSILGSLVAWAKMSPIRLARGVADAYTTTLRGVPDLLVIYLLYFGGNSLLSTFAGFFGANGFVGMPTFATGVLAIGIISAAYQAEVLRGAFNTVARAVARTVPTSIAVAANSSVIGKPAMSLTKACQRKPKSITV